jgi:multidrug efflux system membrane fusion protein
MNTQRAAFISILLTSAAVDGCADAHADSKAPAPPAVAVRVVPVERATLDRSLRAVGRLAHKRSLTLSFKNGGTLRALLVQEGALVHKGQALALVDQTEIAAEVAQARAQLSKADRDRTRVDRLQASAAIAQSDADNAHTATDIAHAALAAALYNQSAAVLLAPEDGRVDKRLAEVGEQVGPGAPVYAMSGSTSGMVLRVGVVDRDVVDLALGDRAEITLDALPRRGFTGAVSEIALVPSASSGTYEVELRLATSDATLIAGMTAKATIARRPGPALPVVPLSALIDADASRAALYELVPLGDALSVRRVPIEIAYFAGDRVAVASGLSGSERILSEGASFVEPGREVRPIESGEAEHAPH